jgi:DNA-binding NtrC family response regulator
MPAEVLLVVADEALRQVLAVALAADGCTVRPVADTSAARAVLAAHRPDLLVIDGTMGLPAPPEAWAAAQAPEVPLVLLRSAWDEDTGVIGPHTTLLRMPFGLSALRQAVAEALATRLRR